MLCISELVGGETIQTTDGLLVVLIFLYKQTGAQNVVYKDFLRVWVLKVNTVMKTEERSHEKQVTFYTKVHQLHIILTSIHLHNSPAFITFKAMHHTAFLRNIFPVYLN